MSVLYRKYRSKTLDELVGQDHIVKALKSSIASGKIAHAYLLTGPRGTGKTSVARLIAYAVNGIDYDENATQLDIIEIDAASNRRIDEIRDLRDKVHIAPTSLKYKVYIIDEVHMLTKEAFNALLKTLEEPPEHCIFILATTELQKVPDTIISRTQRYSFKPIAIDKIVSHLAAIAEKEKISYDADGLKAIAEHADGGFRDAISLLDQVRHTADKVTADSVMDALGIPPDAQIENLWQAMLRRDSTAYALLGQITSAGYHAPQITKRLLQKAIDAGEVELATKLLSVGSLGDAKVELQLAVLSLSSAQQSPVTPPVAIVQESPKIIAPTPDPKPQPQAQTPHKPEATETEKSKVDPTQNNDVWHSILEHIKQAGHSVYGPLRLAEASLENEVLRLGLAFPFHVKRVNEHKNLQAIKDAVKSVTGKEYEIVVQKTDKTPRINQDSPSESKQTKSPQQQPVADISEPDPDAELMSDPLSIVKNVFGGAEVL